MIAKGSPTVFIGGLMAARLGDQTVHGGTIVKGAARTFIGNGKGQTDNSRECAKAAADRGSATISRV